jgi:hypothetical protein
VTYDSTSLEIKTLIRPANPCPFVFDASASALAAFVFAFTALFELVALPTSVDSPEFVPAVPSSADSTWIVGISSLIGGSGDVSSVESFMRRRRA